jgi:hypothetical protein
MLSNRELQALAKATAEVTKGLIEPLKERIDALEQQQKNFRYRGTWSNGKGYEKGNFVSHAGGLWHANESTSDKPGQSNSWTLAVKSGDR